MKKIFSVACIVVLFASCSDDNTALPYDDQLAADVSSIDNYLSANNATAEADPSGLRYSIISNGSDFTPLLPDSIQATYSLSLLNGTSIFQDATNTLLLSKVISAWRIALPWVGEGAKLKLYVPSGLGYGAYRTGPIPANSNLIFDVELKKVIREYSSQLVRDVAAIDAYLASQNITAQKNAANLRYVVASQGAANAIAPFAADSVVLNYTSSSLLQLSTQLESENIKGLKLNARSTMAAWKSVLPLLREGTTATIYVPSGLAYGAYGKGSVLPYTNLVYQVEVVKVIRL